MESNPCGATGTNLRPCSWPHLSSSDGAEVGAKVVAKVGAKVGAGVEGKGRGRSVMPYPTITSRGILLVLLVLLVLLLICRGMLLNL